MLFRIIFFAFTLNYAYGCTTPDNQIGNCIEVKKCPKINAIFVDQQRSHAENKFLAESFCKPITDRLNPKVCCESDISKANSLLPKPEECGNSAVPYKDNEPTFSTENITKPTKYPWMALIEYKTKADSTVVTCGGTLISNKYILTAAHCVVGYVFENEFVPKTVRLGDHRIGEFDCTIQENLEDCNKVTFRSAIEKITPHPKFDVHDPYFRNNIALIKLSRRVHFTDDIQPICLPNNDILKIDKAELILAGWGTGSGPATSFELKKHKKTKVVDQRKCNETLSVNGGFELSDMQFCAGDDGNGNCVADGGNGAIHFANGKYYLAGIVSIGTHLCANAAIPDVFTNVYHYKAWIAEQVVV